MRFTPPTRACFSHKLFLSRRDLAALHVCFGALWAAALSGFSVAQEAGPSFPAVGPEPLGKVSPGAAVLWEGWQMRESAITGTDGAAISQSGFKTKDWYATTIPTTVLGVLVRHGIYPDPYIGTNNMRIPDASDEHNARYKLAGFSHLPDKSNPWAKPYWFRRQFSLPKEFAGKKVWLNLDGINYRADIWLNGKQLADSRSAAGMFERFRFEISGQLNQTGQNALAVLIHPPDHTGDPVYEQLDGLKGGFGPNGGDGEILRNVMQYGAIGWDWVPAARDRNIGIWQHVWLEATGPVVVRDPAAFTDVRLPEGDSAAVTLRLQLQNAEPVQQKVELVASIKPEGFEGDPIEVRENVTLAPSAVTEVVFKPDAHPELIMRKPRLWWPVTYGEQPLYQLAIEARVDGKPSSRSERSFGVRKVGSHVLPSGGRAFTVNGRTIRLTGGAWVPDYLMSWSAQRYRDEVRLMAAGNHTVVRINGSGIIPPDAFFEACDGYGLMVWQDLSRTSILGTHRKDGKKGWSPVDCDDPALWLSNMRDCVLRLRGSTSLLVWCGSNEAAAQEALGVPMQNEILPELDGTRPWLPSSSEQPSWAKEPMRVWTGGPWSLVRLPEYFALYATKHQFTARNEIGLPSTPPLNSIARAIPDYNQPDPASFPLNITLGYHDATAMFRSLDAIIRKDLGEPLNLPEYLLMGDLYNEASYRAIFEAANKVRPRNSGTHLWKVNAAWPSIMWQVFDWYLRPNAGYYSMRSACKPLHVQASVDDFAVQVVSTLPGAKLGLTLRIKVVGLDGAVKAEEVRKVDATADATTTAGVLPEVVRDGKLHFIVLELLDPQGAEADRTVVWMQKDCLWSDLLKLEPAEVKAEVLDRSERDGETLFRVRAENRSRVPAVQVWLEVLRGSMGEEVLPSFWNDNAITLLPGEKREVTVGFRTTLLKDATPHLAVGGWNVRPFEVNANTRQPTPMRLAVSKASMEPGSILTFKVEQVSTKGDRYNNWQIPVKLDGALVRWVRTGLRTGEKNSLSLPIPGPMAPGSHTVCVGEEGKGAVITVDASQ